jgi:hypothetical protein
MVTGTSKYNFMLFFAATIGARDSLRGSNAWNRLAAFGAFHSLLG